jgi:hypothetical protein
MNHDSENHDYLDRLQSISDGRTWACTYVAMKEVAGERSNVMSLATLLTAANLQYAP